jgi:hypothetical protein
LTPREHHHKIEGKNSSVKGSYMPSDLLPMNYSHFVLKKKLLLGIYTCEGFSKHPFSFWELQPCFYICMKVEEPPKHNLEEHETLLMTSPLTWSSHHTTAGDKYRQTIHPGYFVCCTFSPAFQKSLQSKISKKVSEHLDGNFSTNIMDINLATCARRVQT